MTDLALAPARAAAPATGAPSAAGLAARIEVPRRLPVRYDGQPIRHLSNSSYTLFLALPGRVAAPVPARREGAAERGDVPRLPRRRDADPLLPPLARAPRTTRTARAQTLLRSQLEAAARRRERQARRRVGRAPDRHTALKLGVKALDHRVRGARATARRAGRGATTSRVPARARDRVDDRGSPGPRNPPPGPGRRGTVEEIVDYKVKAGSAITETTAARNPQASLYLAARWLEGRPAARVPVRPDPAPAPGARHSPRSLIPHRAQRRGAAVDARADRARGQPDRRSPRPLRAGPAVGVRRPDQLEMRAALLPALGACPGGAGL